MTNSSIAIRGNHLENTNLIFETFKYQDTYQDKAFDNWQEFDKFLSENFYEFAINEIALRGIWFENGWTIINDPEMTDTVEEEILLELSRKLNTDVFTFIIQTTSNSFGFAFYNNTIKRNFLFSDGKIMNNQFQPLPEENGLNLNGKISTNDILKLASNFGIYLEGKNSHRFIVKQLAYSAEMKNVVERFKSFSKQSPSSNKPWWKIW